MLGEAVLNFWTAPNLRGTFASNQRLLDVRVLSLSPSLANITVEGTESFAHVWLQAQQARASVALADRAVNGTQWAALFVQLRQRLPERMQVEPLRAHSCADKERCIGTNMEGRCVCCAPPTPARSPLPSAAESVI